MHLVSQLLLRQAFAFAELFDLLAEGDFGT